MNLESGSEQVLPCRSDVEFGVGWFVLCRAICDGRGVGDRDRRVRCRPRVGAALRV